MRAVGLPPELRFWRQVQRGGLNDCWKWTGAVERKGYGMFRVNVSGRYSNRAAHRVAYELLVGPVPDGLQLDHLCRNTSCVNPRHLEPVTAAENVRRANEHRTACKHGHEYTAENTHIDPAGWRVCRACRNRKMREYNAQRRAAA